MKDCWLGEPGLRPTFTELAEKIGEELQEGEQEVQLKLLSFSLAQNENEFLALFEPEPRL